MNRWATSPCQVNGSRLLTAVSASMALESEHAPHFNGLKMFRGSYHKDLQRLPRRAAGWREGQTLSYLIDFLERPGALIVY